jgi:demethylmenaquinone methyltransferase/2-methoxy-6-polyprenyl-1,4-benzoquinol methylase
MMGTQPEDISPVNRPLAKAGEYYTRLAPWYDFLASSEKKYIQNGLDLLALQSHESILEIGFGTGFAQRKIIPVLDGGISIGVDLSTGMAFLAHRNLTKAGIADQANLVCSDSLPLPFRSECFDAVFTSFTLELFDTPLIPKLLDEIRRVLRSSGRLVVVSLSKDQPLGFMGRFYESFHNRFPAIADCRPIPVLYLLEEYGLKVIETRFSRMWGLGVSMVKAKPSTFQINSSEK